jgi:tetratricopeptide (TPR) repeat protein
MWARFLIPHLLLAIPLRAQYAGAEACRACHPKQYADQSKTGHAHALAPSPDPKLGEWAFGAGAKAITYVSQSDPDTYAEHGLSYFAEKHGTALTPGHATPSDVLYRLFDPDATVLRCFRCHSTGLIAVTESLKIQPAEAGVRCEACHGPGKAHVEAGGSKQTILNPARLGAVELNELCGSCHRKPVENDWTDPWKSRHQPSYLVQAACFRKSKGKLSCVTCHNPHAPLIEKASDYNATCLSCHKAVAHRTAVAGKACSGCHMPQVPTGLPIHFTNHWIGIYAPGKPLTPMARLARPLPPPPRPRSFVPPSDASTLRPLFEQRLSDERSYSDYGLFLKNTGDLAGAEAALRHAKSLPADFENLATVLVANHKPAEAVGLYQRAADGPDPAVASRSLATLATLDPANAETYYRRALGAEEQASGANHPRVAILLNNLAAEIKARGDYPAAEALLRQALSIQRKTLGPESPAAGLTMTNLGSLLQTEGKLNEAEQLERSAVRILEQKLGPFSAELSAALTNLADLCWTRQSWQSAEALYRRAIIIDESIYGPGNPEVAADLVNLGLLFKETRQTAQAVATLRRALEIYESALGPSSTQAAEVRKDLSSVGH